VQIVAGTVAAGGEILEVGTGLAISDEAGVVLEASTGAELLVFDLP
jgi:translation initiation factor 6 (eIF-6)